MNNFKPRHNFSESEEKKILQTIKEEKLLIKKRGGPKTKRVANVSQKKLLSLLAETRKSENYLRAVAQILFLFEQQQQQQQEEQTEEERDKETASPPSPNEFTFPDFAFPSTELIGKKKKKNNKETNSIRVLSSGETKKESFPLHPFAEIFKPLLLSSPVITKKRAQKKEFDQNFRTVVYVDSSSSSESESETELDHNSDLDSPLPQK